jgi:nitrogen-specific signal transduction histidine kinase
VIPASRSLMDFIQTPVLVGDPDGRAVYVNPAFERDFQLVGPQIVGRPLANLFEGGGREAVLLAVAQVCDGTAQHAVRFGLLAGQRAYKALASPVEVEGGRVGVILLLTAEASAEGRIQSFRREISASLDELTACLASLAEPGLANPSHQHRLLIADGVRAIERMRKWAGAVAARLTDDDAE